MGKSQISKTEEYQYILYIVNICAYMQQLLIINGINVRMK
jgi:hypothetical protein